MNNNHSNNTNPLETQRVSVLLAKFALPSIIAMLVGALYNIIDQFFIGRSVGPLGNAATNIVFPLSISCVAIALLFGIGGSASFNLAMGSKDEKRALGCMGNAMTMLVIAGSILLVITEIFLSDMLLFFGSPYDVLAYAKEYTSITAIGFPFIIFSTGAGHLIRAAGKPNHSMIVNISGAVVNTVLDAVFVFGLDMEMKGAALATVIGQIVSALLAVIFIFANKSLKLTGECFIIRKFYVTKVMALGMAPCSNQLAMMVVQIVMNKSLGYYGAMSDYGESIPIACAGIISKVNMVFFSLIIGISQGLQPIMSFNYGAKKYKRVKEAYRLAVTVGFILSVIAFLMFQLFPRQIIAAFGDGSEEYYAFATTYFRVFLFFTFVNFMQPITSNSFTAIGKPLKGVFLSLTRQIIFLLPLILILPWFLDINGILYAGPVADFISFIVAVTMLIREFSNEEYRRGA